MESSLLYFPYFNPLPRKEGDGLPASAVDRQHYFNPLPRKEGDCFIRQRFTDVRVFQSTPS